MSNVALVIENLPPELRDSQSILSITESQSYTKTLGIQWNSKVDLFCLTINELPQWNNPTNREPVSDIVKTFDVLGWFSLTIVKAESVGARN